jgi:hypothetical protein
MIVGDVRSEECLDLPGLATIHANSARELLIAACADVG